MSLSSRRLRGIAVLAVNVAIGVYIWGLLHLGGAFIEAEDGGTNSAPIPPCRGNEQAVHVIDYSVSFLPLSFDCELKGGGSYGSEAIPSYVNPVTLGLALTAAVCAVSAAYVTESRLRGEAQ